MSLHYKTVLCICNIAAFAMAAYAYKRHNLYCEPGGDWSTVLPHTADTLHDTTVLHFLVLLPYCCVLAFPDQRCVCYYEC